MKVAATKLCSCGTSFEIDERQTAFYHRMQVPPPESCPHCRMQHRFAFRNESTLYRRKCDKTGESILSMYSQDKPFPVYAPEVWFGDSWDARDYGVVYDFGRPFFDQLLELRNRVPHLSLISHANENSDFCNIVGTSKNCYLLYGSINCEDCYYGNPFDSKDCSDSLLLRNSELCLECVDSKRLYHCYRAQNCADSRDLMFCFDVKNSANCFGCVGLNRKQYSILNKPYIKEDYERIMASMNLFDPEQFKHVMEKFEALKRSVPHRSYTGTQNENVSGDYIFNSKDCYDSYFLSNCQDVSFGYQMLEAKDCQDVCNGEYGELIYNLMGFYDNVNRVRYSAFVWGGIDEVWYSMYCTQNVKHCFGGVGLRRTEYCILNKSYSKEDYEALIPRIIAHMKSTGEWGQFLPMQLSSFSYNETIAQEYFPLTKEEVSKRGWAWKEEETVAHAEVSFVPDVLSVDQIVDELADHVYRCEVTGKPYRIIPQELKFYRRFRVPLPRRSPKQRHVDRVALRNPMELWDRTCGKCGVPIKTTISSHRPEAVYCESCYLTAVY